MPDKKRKMIKTHVSIPWHEYVAGSDEVPIKDAPFKEKASVVGRLGLMMLAGGTTAWRVRSSMQQVAHTLGIVCTADVGMDSISYTCMDGTESITQTLSRGGPGVNTYKIHMMESFVREFDSNCENLSAEKIHSIFDKIKARPENHKLWFASLASGLACAALAFNLGAGVAELICIFFGALIGQLCRKLVSEKGLSLFISLVVGAAVSCAVYAGVMFVIQNFLYPSAGSGAGYIGSMLYLVPGFPFLTAVLDFAKMDMRSGTERIIYSGIVMIVTSMIAAVAQIVFKFEAEGLVGITLGPVMFVVLRLLASFIGIYGFSMAFNSSHRMALCAALTGFIPSVVRMLLIKYVEVPTTIGAFIQAFLVGIIAYFVVKKTHYPRVSITIPAVVIAVPGFYIHQSVYSFTQGDASGGINAFLLAASIIFALAMGVLFSRFITDPHFRHRD